MANMRLNRNGTGMFLKSLLSSTTQTHSSIGSLSNAKILSVSYLGAKYFVLITCHMLFPLNEKPALKVGVCSHTSDPRMFTSNVRLGWLVLWLNKGRTNKKQLGVKKNCSHLRIPRRKEFPTGITNSYLMT